MATRRRGFLLRRFALVDSSWDGCGERGSRGNLYGRGRESGIRVANKSLEAAEALLEKTRTQYKVGVVSKVEVTRFRAQNMISGAAMAETTAVSFNNAMAS